MADTRLKVVAIANYPREPRYMRMLYVFLDSIIAHGAKSVTLMYETNPPAIAPEHRRAIDLEVVRASSHEVGHPHFNLRFKLANLSRLDYPFLYLDIDTVVLGDLNHVWQRRHDRPWVGINHQYVPGDPRTHRAPFLNSGFQLVGDPAFYDLDAILAVQNAAIPLSRHTELTPWEMFPCPGMDQAILFRYFQTIGYDYTHPEIGGGWNCCAGVTELRREGNRWQGHSRHQTPDYDVSINHHWAQFKPWLIDCPIYRSYEWVDQRKDWTV